MKHAYLIMAHEDIYTLKTLIELLDHPQNDIYVHWDIKSKPNLDYQSINLKFSKIYIMDRMDVRWADISQVLCELNLFKMAIKKDYDYYHLLSGSDIPLKTQSEIHKFFKINKGKEFIHFSDIRDDDSVYYFISKYHLLQRILSHSKFTFLTLINKILIILQNIIRIDRLKKKNIVLKKGANWVSVSHNFLSYLLSKESYIKETFRWTKSPDEFFTQTIIYNSEYRKKLYLYDNDDNYLACMRKIDWNRGMPYIYRINDYEDLINSNYLFARKFNSTVDKEIIDKIANTIKEKSDTQIV